MAAKNTVAVTAFPVRDAAMSAAGFVCGKKKASKNVRSCLNSAMSLIEVLAILTY